MDKQLFCSECHAAWQEGEDCQTAFHQMLFWEAEHPDYGEVHHLMVLCYHLQHPSRYSPEGLQYGIQLLVDFLERGLTPEQVCSIKSSQVDSGRRDWKIKGTTTSHGAYPQLIRWEMNAIKVVARGEERYLENVREWASTMLTDLRDSGNLVDRENPVGI